VLSQYLMTPVLRITNFIGVTNLNEQEIQEAAQDLLFFLLPQHMTRSRMSQIQRSETRRAPSEALSNGEKLGRTLETHELVEVAEGRRPVDDLSAGQAHDALRSRPEYSRAESMSDAELLGIIRTNGQSAPEGSGVTVRLAEAVLRSRGGTAQYGIKPAESIDAAGRIENYDAQAEVARTLSNERLTEISRSRDGATDGGVHIDSGTAERELAWRQTAAEQGRYLGERNFSLQELLNLRRQEGDVIDVGNGLMVNRSVIDMLIEARQPLTADLTSIKDSLESRFDLHTIEEVFGGGGGREAVLDHAARDIRSRNIEYEMSRNAGQPAETVLRILQASSEGRLEGLGSRNLEDYTYGELAAMMGCSGGCELGALAHYRFSLRDALSGIRAVYVGTAAFFQQLQRDFNEVRERPETGTPESDGKKPEVVLVDKKDAPASDVLREVADAARPTEIVPVSAEQTAAPKAGEKPSEIQRPAKSVSPEDVLPPAQKAAAAVGEAEALASKGNYKAAEEKIKEAKEAQQAAETQAQGLISGSTAQGAFNLAASARRIQKMEGVIKRGNEIEALLVRAFEEAGKQNYDEAVNLILQAEDLQGRDGWLGAGRQSLIIVCEQCNTGGSVAAQGPRTFEGRRDLVSQRHAWEEAKTEKMHKEGKTGMKKVLDHLSKGELSEAIRELAVVEKLLGSDITIDRVLGFMTPSERLLGELLPGLSRVDRLSRMREIINELRFEKLEAGRDASIAKWQSRLAVAENLPAGPGRNMAIAEANAVLWLLRQAVVAREGGRIQDARRFEQEAENLMARAERAAEEAAKPAAPLRDLTVDSGKFEIRAEDKREHGQAHAVEVLQDDLGKLAEKADAVSGSRHMDQGTRDRIDTAKENARQTVDAAETLRQRVETAKQHDMDAETHAQLAHEIDAMKSRINRTRSEVSEMMEAVQAVAAAGRPHDGRTPLAGELGRYGEAFVKEALEFYLQSGASLDRVIAALASGQNEIMIDGYGKLRLTRDVVEAAQSLWNLKDADIGRMRVDQALLEAGFGATARLEILQDILDGKYQFRNDILVDRRFVWEAASEQYANLLHEASWRSRGGSERKGKGRAESMSEFVEDAVRIASGARASEDGSKRFIEKSGDAYLDRLASLYTRHQELQEAHVLAAKIELARIGKMDVLDGLAKDVVLAAMEAGLDTRDVAVLFDILGDSKRTVDEKITGIDRLLAERLEIAGRDKANLFLETTLKIFDGIERVDDHTILVFGDANHSACAAGCNGRASMDGLVSRLSERFDELGIRYRFQDQFSLHLDARQQEYYGRRSASGASGALEMRRIFAEGRAQSDEGVREQMRRAGRRETVSGQGRLAHESAAEAVARGRRLQQSRLMAEAFAEQIVRIAGEWRFSPDSVHYFGVIQDGTKKVIRLTGREIRDLAAEAGAVIAPPAMPGGGAHPAAPVREPEDWRLDTQDRVNENQRQLKAKDQELQIRKSERRRLGFIRGIWDTLKFGSRERAFNGSTAKFSGLKPTSSNCRTGSILTAACSRADLLRIRKRWCF